MQFAWSTDLTSQVVADALTIRRAVFMDEQGVSEAIEIDGLDGERTHLVVYQADRPVGTARIYPIDKETIKVQRVAVTQDQRGSGVGRQLMLAIETWAQQHGFSRLYLSAQDAVIPFYERLGYHLMPVEGYEDAGIPHHDMEKFI